MYHLIISPKMKQKKTFCTVKVNGVETTNTITSIVWTNKNNRQQQQKNGSFFK